MALHCVSGRKIAYRVHLLLSLLLLVQTQVPTSELKCVVFLKADIEILKNTKAAIKHGDVLYF